MKAQQLALASVMILLSAIALSTPTQADEFTCTGNLGAITVSNLRVPDGATCNLNGARVDGTIKVESEAVLVVRNVQVKGNIQAENAAQVTALSGTTVGGSIQVKQSGGATVLNSRISGDLQFDDNTQALVSQNNYIGGNLQAVKNRGGLRIVTNRIDGNLQCKGNRPAPTGSGNVVRGNKEDQCDRL